MLLRRVRFALLLVAVSTIALVGCAPSVHGAGHPAPTHVAPRHTPKADPPALDTTAPPARLNVPCSSLLTPAELTAYEGTVPLIPTSALAAGDLADAASLMPVADYLREAGDIDCIWSTGPVDHYNLDTSDTPQYLEITVQFDAAHAWAINAPNYGISGNEGGECDEDSVGGECQTDHLIGTGTWVDIYTRKAQGPDPDQIQNIENTAVAAVTAAGTPAAVPTPQAGTRALGSNCLDFASTTAVQTALGISAPLTALTPPPLSDDPTDIPVWYASQDTLHNHPCSFRSGTTTEAQIAWIPGGAWAWAENKTQTLGNAPLQAISLAHLKPHDDAWIRCAASDAACTVDIVLRGNWIEATVPASSGATNKRTAATALAQSIAGLLG